jgi:hypothetical protein
MNPTNPLTAIAPDLWRITYPLKTLGVDLNRNVTIIRLASGKLIIHSSAPFLPEDVAAISQLGQPSWIVDTLLRHDTFVREGREAFPEASYLGPDGFAADVDFPVGLLLPPPAEWQDELDVLAVAGAPEMGEIVFHHRPSRTLIVADLLVNFGDEEGLWAEILIRAATVGAKHEPGMTRPFKMAIKDEGAFEASIREILSWDFDRIIVGHGDVIETGGKEKLRVTLQYAGFEGL